MIIIRWLIEFKLKNKIREKKKNWELNKLLITRHNFLVSRGKNLMLIIIPIKRIKQNKTKRKMK